MAELQEEISADNGCCGDVWLNGLEMREKAAVDHFDARLMNVEVFRPPRSLKDN